MLREAVICSLACFAVVFSKPEYRDHIPNGHHVPNPCDGSIWQAVGHFETNDGKHGRNSFGEDFKHLGDKSWTHALCHKDSDGDGKTNGEELGDPSCIWTRHGSHNVLAVTGHPAICEPVGSPACNHQQFDCTNLFGHHHHG